MNRTVKNLLCVALLVCCGELSLAQNINSGDIRGTVTDQSGAAISGATVSVLNLDTNVTKTFTTNHDGVYDTSSILTGTYRITISAPGFEQFVRGPITLQVGFTSINGQLKIGATNEQVVVNTDVPLMNTETSEQSTTLDSKQMALLPQVTQSWENFVVLFPGFAGSANTSQGANLPQAPYVSANGNLPYVNLLTDGASNTLDHSQNGTPAAFETVAELQATTSSFSAQYGTGGIIFNQITKGGTNRFHGTAYEFFQNDALNAANYGFGNKVTVPFLRYNNFGGAVGGPILKNKVFFYFDYDQTINHGSYTTYNTIPTAAVMGGNFTGQRQIFDPTTQTIAYDAKGNPYPVRQPFANNTIPNNLFDSVATKIQQYYPTPSSHISNGQFVSGSLNNGLLQNNFYTQVLQSTPSRNYFGRLDWDVTKSNRISMSDTENDVPAVYPSAVTACPLGCESGDVDSNNSQITDVWTISPRTTNEARMGFTFQGSFFGDLSIGHGYPSQLGWQFAKADTFPSIHYLTTYPYAWIEPSTNAVYKSETFDPSDVVTMVRGKHILHYGGEFLFYRDNSTAWGNVNAGTLEFSGQYTQHWSLNAQGIASPDSSTGLEYADFLLGYAHDWSASVAPEFGGRFKTPQVFIQDDYKLRQNLTLNLGLRWQINHGWNEVHDNIDSFDPAVTNPANNKPGAYWYASTKANGRAALMQNVYDDFLPRVGFAWSVDPKTTLRGGWGLYAMFWSLDNYGGNNTTFGMGATFGNSGNYTDQTNGVTPATKLNSGGTVFGTGSPLPYTAASTDPTRFNGQSVGYIPYKLQVPKIQQWNLDMQREISPNVAFELAYVASHGENLLFNSDLNQVPITQLSSNDAANRPYPIYQGIAAYRNIGVSNYNSLQVTVSRRLHNGFGGSVNYVWSHFLDDQDSAGRGGYGGPTPYQINDPSQNYSNSNFDVRNAFKGYASYELPFGIGKRYLNTNRIVDGAIGGWRLSATMHIASGNPFTIYATQNTYALAGSSFPNYAGTSVKPAHRSVNEWYNPAAFSLPANGTFGNVRRNSLYGPGLDVFNMSLGKTLSLPERLKLDIRADATNVLNHASFSNPNGSLSSFSGQQVGQAYTSPSSGQITGTTVGGRTMQLSGRISF